MDGRDVERSVPDGDVGDEEDGGVWQRIVDRLIGEGEPPADAIRLADRMVRRRRVDTSRTSGVPDGGGGGDGRSGSG